MLSTTFHDRGIGADDPDFSIDLTWSMVTIRTAEILYIIRRNCYTSQGDPDSSFPYLPISIDGHFQLNHKLQKFCLFDINRLNKHVNWRWIKSLAITNMEFPLLDQMYIFDIFLWKMVHQALVTAFRLFELIHFPMNLHSISNECNLNEISYAPCKYWAVPIHIRYFVRNLTLYHFLLSPDVWNICVSINLTVTS